MDAATRSRINANGKNKMDTSQHLSRTKDMSKNATPRTDAATLAMSMDETLAKAEEWTREPTRRTQGCKHPIERMRQWIDEGACPVCLSADFLGQKERAELSEAKLTVASACIAKLEARVAELEKDAERYRWLKERHFEGYYSPADGGGATYRWNPDPTEADNDKGIVRPDSGGTGAWVYEPPDNAD